jgi:beta-N-acetylhexosaminidase
MKKTFIYFFILLLVAVAVALAFLSLARSEGESSVFSFFTAKWQAPTEEERIWQAIDEQIETMTVEEKVGQLFMIGFGGKTVTPELQQIFLKKHWGGVILLGYNLGSSENIKNLISDLQALSDIPLFISVDQEGGPVSRLKNINTVGQSKIMDEAEAHRVAQERGGQLRELGFNINYAPVLDFVQQASSFLYDRVFRGSLAERGLLGRAMVEAYQSAQIIPVIKHFPGHPDDKVDSHQALPTAYLSKETVLSNAQNFKDALNAGPMMVMSGHIAYPLVDEQYPSSLSKIFLTDILRVEWNYDGVIITDDLEMGALQNNFSNQEIARLAFLAGNDILLYSSTVKKQLAAYDIILQMVLSGEISEERLNQSVRRILFLKNQIFNLYD